MPLHLRKLSVGTETIDGLEAWQAQRLAMAGPEGLMHVTRSWPRQADDILAAEGSIYWIIKGAMSARQRIRGFVPVSDMDAQDDPEAKPLCGIQLIPGLIRTEPWPHRPFQGWRYLKSEEAPPDLPKSTDADLPSDLVGALRLLGAW